MTEKVKRKFSLNQLLDVPVTDPDDARRRKLLNIILMSIGMLSLVILLYTLGYYLTNLQPGDVRQDILIVFPSGFAILVLTVVFYMLNRTRKMPGWIVSTLFLVFLCVLIAGTDSAAELSAGRSLFVWTIPVVLAAFLLRPWGGFLFTALVTVEMGILAYISGQLANPTAIVGLLLIAGIAWLAARSLEQALKEVRQVNINLDHLVKERTRDLEEALLRERVALGQFQATIESLRDGVIVFDQSGKSLVVNPAMAHLFECKREEALARPIFEMIGERDLAPRDRSALLALLTTQATQPANRRIRWGQKYLSIWGAPVYSSGETTRRIGTVALFQDITTEVEAERMKDMFLAMVSHELRTPINAIMGYTDILLAGMRGDMSDVQMETLGRISRNSQRLFDLVGDLLDQAQIQAGTLRISPEPFEIATVIEEVRNTFESRATAKGLTLTTNISPGIPTNLVGDPGRIRQIIINFVSNAIKFTESGAVDIRVLPIDQKQWAIEVQDTGIGIPEDKLSSIFDPFYQVDDTPTRKVGGFGLGLAIVRSLVEIMGGWIRVESKVGNGSKFTVILPVKTIARDID